MCLEYYWWRDVDPKDKDSKWETLLCGDGLGICHMWNFQRDWHTCQYKEGSLEPVGCLIHRDDIIKNFKDQVEKQYEAAKSNKKNAQKFGNDKSKKGTDDADGDKDLQVQAASNSRQKRKVIKYEKVEIGVSYIDKVIHRS